VALSLCGYNDRGYPWRQDDRAVGGGSDHRMAGADASDSGQSGARLCTERRGRGGTSRYFCALFSKRVRGLRPLISKRWYSCCSEMKACRSYKWRIAYTDSESSDHRNALIINEGFPAGVTSPSFPSLSSVRISHLCCSLHPF
jgi:hypothetical protein